MDKLICYRQVIKTVLQDYADFERRALPSELETHVIFDDIHDRYMFYRVGWRDKTRINTPVLYLHLKNGKIWIEEDWTEEGIATELLRADVPREDIVLAFHHPSRRPYTEFAVA